jgi:predicted RNase H-like HicB family nuclease
MKNIFKCGGYFANYRELINVMGDGESVDDAIADVKSAFNLYIEVATEKGSI